MEKIINKTARVLSWVFTPLMAGTYAMILATWLSFLTYNSLKARIIVLAVTFVATCVVHVLAIFGLWKAGVVKEPGLNDRRDRMAPYLVTVAGYLAVAVYTWFVNAPLWLTFIVGGAGLAILAVTVINRWWKISGHAAGMGGLCGVVFFMMISEVEVAPLQWEFLALIFLSGLVGTARLILDRHTPWQVGAGWLVGFAGSFLLPLLAM